MWKHPDLAKNQSPTLTNLLGNIYSLYILFSTIQQGILVDKKFLFHHGRKNNAFPIHQNKQISYSPSKHEAVYEGGTTTANKNVIA